MEFCLLAAGESLKTSYTDITHPKFIVLVCAFSWFCHTLSPNLLLTNSVKASLQDNIVY